MPRLQQLFNRAQPTQEEIHILRGIAKAMAQPPRGAAKTPSASGEEPGP
jgi:tRNA/rRNA methyltransferase